MFYRFHKILLYQQQNKLEKNLGYRARHNYWVLSARRIHNACYAKHFTKYSEKENKAE